MSPQPFIEVTSLTKDFPGVKALDSVNVAFHTGKLHALIGENGAGKSTLVNILAGVHRPSEGVVTVDGREQHFTSPHDPGKLGIHIVHQEFHLVQEMSICENLMLGQEITRTGIISMKEQEEKVHTVMANLGLEPSPREKVKNLSVADQQLVEIAKGLLHDDIRCLILDEPTATLTYQEEQRFFEILEKLRREGVALIYISHRLEEIMRLADEVTVLRNGKQTAHFQKDNYGMDDLIQAMVGKINVQGYPHTAKGRTENAAPLLKVENLGDGKDLKAFNLEIHPGQIVGLGGLIGSGRTEMARLIYGADPAREGRMTFKGRDYSPRSPKDAIHHGIVMLSEDRKTQGLVLDLPMRDNIAMNAIHMPEYTGTFGWMKGRKIQKEIERLFKELQVRPDNPKFHAKQFSGGNQQKALLARALLLNADLYIFDEPTRGIDIGARWEIYQLMEKLIAQGKSILMISSDMNELLGMSDNILVMRSGECVGQLNCPVAAEKVLELAFGQTQAAS